MKHLFFLFAILLCSTHGGAKHLLQEVLQTGDGKSYETAFVVSDIEQEFEVLKHFKHQPRLQMLAVKDGIFYDLIQTESGVVYFRITKFFGKKAESQ